MFARRPGEAWHEVSPVGFHLEAELEELLAESPELLPGRPTNLALVRQLHVPAVNGYLDLCGVASDGSIYVIKCKLSGNPEMRRTVVGQVLAYAAGLAALDVDEFTRVFAAAARNSGRTWSSAEDWFERIPDAERDADYSPAALRERLTRNLSTGRFHLVVAVDAVPDELALIVGYLEQQMQHVSISALELSFSKVGDVELIKPTLHGARYEAVASSSALASTTVQEFDEAQSRLHPAVGDAFGLIRVEAAAAGATFWGLRKSSPTLGATYVVEGRQVTPWVMSARGSKPGFGVMWAWMRGAVPLERLEVLLDELRVLPGSEIWQGVERKWNYVNYLDATRTFKDPAAAPLLIAALHRALGTPAGSA